MSLEGTINREIKKAMLNKQSEELRALRTIKSELLLLKTSKDTKKSISEEDENKLLQKLIKQRKESLQIYKSNHRDDLAAKEEQEIKVIEKFMPKQLPIEEVEKVVHSIIQENNFATMKDMGRAMGIASKQLAGKADNKTISEIIKNTLS